MAELVRPAPLGPAGDEVYADDNGDGQEGDDAEGGDAVELDVVVDAVRARGEGEEHLHDDDDDHGDGEDDERVEGFEAVGYDARPPDAGVLGAEEALGKQQVHDVEEDDAGVGED